MPAPHVPPRAGAFSAVPPAILEALAAARGGQGPVFGEHANLADTADIRPTDLGPLSEKKVACLSPSARSPAPSLYYADLARYTHRVAISSRRLIPPTRTGVTFKLRTTGSTAPGRYKTMTVAPRTSSCAASSSTCSPRFHRIRTTVCSPTASAPRTSQGPRTARVTKPPIRPTKAAAQPHRRWHPRSLPLLRRPACSSSRPSRASARRVTARPPSSAETRVDTS